MAKQWDGERRTNLHGSLDEMEIISNKLFSVAVHVDSDPEFRTFILAAGTAHAYGNDSIDGVLRKHRADWMRQFETEQAHRGDLQALARKITDIVSRRCKELSAMKLPDSMAYGVVAAANAQIRFESTIRAALVLLRVGHAFEADAVIRQGLEQLAWSHGVLDMTTIEEVEKTDGTGWITRLKSIFPGAGRLYGLLSDYAHLAPETHSRFLDIEDGKLYVTIHAPAMARECMLRLIVLLDAFLVTSEACFHNAGLRCTNIDSASGALLTSRQAVELVQQFEAVLPRGARDIFDSWWK